MTFPGTVFPHIEVFFLYNEYETVIEHVLLLLGQAQAVIGLYVNAW